MSKGLPLLFRHVMYNLRGGFLLRPLAIALALGAVGAVLSWLEELYPSIGAWAPAVLFPSHADPQVAQVILSGIAGSVMTVVSIVFAILLMTLTLASMQFSPRIIVNFSRDRVTQRTLGLFLGTFCYCMAALPAAHELPKPFSPVVTVMGAMALAIVCVAGLLYFIHHISHAISVNYIVDRIAAETEVMLDDFMPLPYGRTPTAQSGDDIDVRWNESVASLESGYIRYMDADRLLELARQYGIKVQVQRRVGHFVPAGVPLLRLADAATLPEQARVELLGAFDIGPSRTLQQDVEFGVLQIVDIALRAISPAVNDPSTAINCIDQLSRILIRFAARQPPEAILFDPPGVVRLHIPWIDFTGLLDTAFDQIRHYAMTDVPVCQRLLRALGDIAATTNNPDYRKELLIRGKRIVAGCAKELGADEASTMNARLATLDKLSQTNVASVFAGR